MYCRFLFYLFFLFAGLNTKYLTFGTLDANALTSNEDKLKDLTQFKRLFKAISLTQFSYLISNSYSNEYKVYLLLLHFLFFNWDLIVLVQIH